MYGLTFLFVRIMINVLIWVMWYKIIEYKKEKSKDFDAYATKAIE